MNNIAVEIALPQDLKQPAKLVVAIRYFGDVRRGRRGGNVRAPEHDGCGSDQN